VLLVCVQKTDCSKDTSSWKCRYESCYSSPHYTTPIPILFETHTSLITRQLREFDRCRTLYTKFLEYNPANCTAWIKFAEIERLLGELDRCRAIFELAVNQPVLDMPEVLWKAYIGEWSARVFSNE
jgi:hypothetical protein